MIDRVEPQVECGRFPVKRVVGDRVKVTANIYADGHEQLAAVLRYRFEGAEKWQETPMKLVANDQWEAEFVVESVGQCVYTIVAWMDKFGTWAADLAKRREAGQDISVDMRIGAGIVESAAERARGADAQRLTAAAERIKRAGEEEFDEAVALVNSDELIMTVNRNRDRAGDTQYERELSVVVDRERAECGAWYEFFPRSCTTDAKRPGTLRSCIQRLDYVAGMGFDILYLPPIHPIGRTERKGKNNSLFPAPDDPGSPWAIGAQEGGHKAIDPRLGTLTDFQELRAQAEKKGIELALDLAYQCSPDHPYVREHREWFRQRPDGTVQYAENPPKKYQDIYPFDFETEHAKELWEELKSVVTYWIGQGIRIFRVDNPHTKPFAFWEWLISGIKKDYPETIFLSEAFTRPAIMYRLAKAGFTQSYTYFTWKNTKAELTEYFTELNRKSVREFFRANLWPNTPDILNGYLQHGGRPAFAARLILAATLGASYGIYGPAFELCENRPIREGSEEYLDSDKYEVRVWDIETPNSLKDLITHVNGIRREHRALQKNAGLRFHSIDNEQLIAYSKVSEDAADAILVVVNLDPHNVQSGWIDVALEEFRLGADESYQVHDLLTDARYVWHGRINFVQLDPIVLPAHILQVRAIG